MVDINQFVCVRVYVCLCVWLSTVCIYKIHLKWNETCFGIQFRMLLLIGWLQNIAGIDISSYRCFFFYREWLMAIKNMYRQDSRNILYHQNWWMIANCRLVNRFYFYQNCKLFSIELQRIIICFSFKSKFIPFDDLLQNQST